MDDERIRQAIIEFRPRLVVIDPIQAFDGWNAGHSFLKNNSRTPNLNLIQSNRKLPTGSNTCDFCFLLKYLFDLPMRVDIVTDDDDQRIDTILDFDNQRQSLKDLAEKYTSIRRKDYLEWRIRLEHEMTKAEEK